jgi:hypothetical protein
MAEYFVRGDHRWLVRRDRDGRPGVAPTQLCAHCRLPFGQVYERVLPGEIYAIEEITGSVARRIVVDGIRIEGPEA